jgi:hypothetical protein
MRLPRMTTRRWMIAVAILAALMGTVLGPRGRLCFEEAAYHASEERSLLQAATSLAIRGEPLSRRQDVRDQRHRMGVIPVRVGALSWACGLRRSLGCMSLSGLERGRQPLL